MRRKLYHTLTNCSGNLTCQRTHDKGLVLRRIDREKALLYRKMEFDEVLARRIIADQVALGGMRIMVGGYRAVYEVKNQWRKGVSP